ncbi:MAG: GIY-YIG nuclease family protein [Dehalococcoidia bacterium]
MYKKFEEYTDEMENLLRQLKSSKLMSAKDLQDIPSQGIYVLYEKSRPIYVGRSNRMRQRLKEHGQDRSTHNSATFAFKLAKESAVELGINVKRMRSILEKDPKFSKLFGQAKRRVAKMRFRFIPIVDQVSQTLFEVYTILKLRTFKNNDFKTH